MIVSDNYKTNIQSFGKRISLKLVIGDMTYINDQIMSCSKSFEGDMFKTIMQYADVELQGLVDVRNKEVSISFGVCKEEPYEYIDWGSFIIDNDSIERSVDKNTTRFTAYDHLCKSSVDYVDLGIEYPITVKNYLAKICDYLGYELITTDFVNANTLIEEEKYLNGKYTFRDVLDQIAEVVAGIILVKNNQLIIKYPTNIDFIVDENNLKTLSILDRYGPINSVVLSLLPQEDNFYQSDKDSISENGLTSVKIANNEIMNKQREMYIKEIFEKLSGFYFYPFSIESFGYAFFEPYDQVVIKDLEGNYYRTVILRNSITVTTGLNEKISAAIPETKVTDYSKATNIEKDLYKTLLQVDKQNQTIEGLVESNTNNSKKIAELLLSNERFNVRVETIEKTVTTVSIAPQYAVSQDKVNSPKEWVESRPDVNEGEYLWMRDKYILSDGSVEYKAERMVSGENGKDATIVSDTPPSDTTQMWLDTSDIPPILKYFNGTEWMMANDQSEEINEVRTSLANLEVKANSIEANVEEVVKQETVTANDLKTLIESYNAFVKATSTSISISLEQSKQYTDELTEKSREIATYFEITEKGLEISASDTDDLELSRINTLMAPDHFAVLFDKLEATKIFREGIETDNLWLSKSLSLTPFIIEDYGSGSTRGWVIRDGGVD